MALAEDDIAGSRAHARGLNRAGILDDAELEAVYAYIGSVTAPVQEVSADA